MSILRFVLALVVAGAVGTLACMGVLKLMSGEFRPELAGGIGGAAGAAAWIAGGTTIGPKKPRV